MKKLLGLMAIAPMGLAACGGSSDTSKIVGDEASDKYQTVVKEAAVSMFGFDDDSNCAHFVTALVDACETTNAMYAGELKDVEEGNADVSISLTDWNTGEADVDGKVVVDVTVEMIINDHGDFTEDELKGFEGQQELAFTLAEIDDKLMIELYDDGTTS